MALKHIHGYICIHIHSPHTDDWRCDQYRWVNNAVRKLPKREPAIKKTYFVADTPNGPCREFMKHSYELIPSNGYVLIHYLGNETATCEFAHGNSKHHLDRQYTRTCPSVLQSIENECTLSTTAKVYRKNITNQTPTSHLPVLQARNSQQTFTYH